MFGMGSGRGGDDERTRRGDDANEKESSNTKAGTREGRAETNRKKKKDRKTLHMVDHSGPGWCPMVSTQTEPVFLEWLRVRVWVRKGHGVIDNSYLI